MRREFEYALGGLLCGMAEGAGIVIAAVAGWPGLVIVVCGIVGWFMLYTSIPNRS